MLLGSKLQLCSPGFQLRAAQQRAVVTNTASPHPLRQEPQELEGCCCCFLLNSASVSTYMQASRSPCTQNKAQLLLGQSWAFHFQGTAGLCLNHIDQPSEWG